jgi:hypothetical protein
MPKGKVTPKKLPSRVQLPSRRGVMLRVKLPERPLARAKGAPLFSELFESEKQGLLEIADSEDRSAKLSLAELSLCDFHAVRALALHGGIIAEDAVDFPCKNCEAMLRVHPCASLPLGPFRDFELDDEELDAMLPLDTPHEIPRVPLGRDGATTVTFATRTAAQAAPLFAALAKRELDVDTAFVTAMGIAKLGTETSPRVIARALSECDEDAFTAVTDLFLRTHYPLRLGAPIKCEACGARNDVDAPYEREVEPASMSWGDSDSPEPTGDVSAEFPGLDAFSEIAHASFQEHVSRFPEGTVDLVITDETPACDDGGEPLLGSYVPGASPDASGVLARPTVTLYVKTFRAMWREEGPYDVAAEIDETVEHELLHHEHQLTGEDPMDDDERAEIVREAQRVIGKKQLARDAAQGLGSDVGEFAKRTWIIWILLLIAGAAVMWADK